MMFIHKTKKGKTYIILYKDKTILFSDIILNEKIINNIVNNLGIKSMDTFTYYLNHVVGVEKIKTRIKNPTPKAIIQVLKRNNIL